MGTSARSNNVLSELITSLVNIQASRYTCAAAMVVMFYDYVLTLPDVGLQPVTLLHR